MLYEGFTVLFWAQFQSTGVTTKPSSFLLGRTPENFSKTYFGAISWGDKLRFLIPQASFVGQENAVYLLSHLPVSLTLPSDPTQGPFPFT